MPQRGFGSLARQVILLSSQQSGATALFIYSGEISCNFTSSSGTSFSDQLQILIDPGITLNSNIVGSLQDGNAPIPLVAPTSWNANDAFSVIAINSPALVISTASDPLLGGPGLYIVAQVTVQNGMLLNAQYQVSVRVTI